MKVGLQNNLLSKKVSFGNNSSSEDTKVEKTQIWLQGLDKPITYQDNEKTELVDTFINGVSGAGVYVVHTRDKDGSKASFTKYPLINIFRVKETEEVALDRHA